MSVVARQSKAFISCNGYLACVCTQSGNTLWSEKMKSLDTRPAAILVKEQIVIAGIGGILVGYNILDGKKVLKDKLSGLGYHSITIADNTTGTDWSECNIAQYEDLQRTKQNE
jgi:hypothetical protein